MDYELIIKTIISFIVGAFWVTAATILAEKKGSKIGGLLASMPSTALVGLLFIGIVSGRQAAITATTLMPVTFGISGIFLFFLRSFHKEFLSWIFWITSHMDNFFCTSFLFWH